VCPAAELLAKVVHFMVHVLGQRVLLTAANVVAVPADPLHVLPVCRCHPTLVPATPPSSSNRLLLRGALPLGHCTDPDHRGVPYVC
jgi:hypothetical protein